MTVKIYYGDELYHHGIKGMKWGIRRYQNEDGTLTDEGRRRLALPDRVHGFVQRAREGIQRRREYNRAKRIVEGGKMRKDGQLILSRNIRSNALSFAAWSGIMNVGISAAKKYASQNAVLFTKNYGAVPVANIAYAGARALAIGTAVGIQVHNSVQTSKMRAYDNATAKERREAEEIVNNYRNRGRQ